MQKFFAQNPREIREEIRGEIREEIRARNSRKKFAREIRAKKFAQEIRTEKFAQEIRTKKFAREIRTKKFAREIRTKKFAREIRTKKFAQEIRAKKFAPKDSRETFHLTHTPPISPPPELKWNCDLNSGVYLELITQHQKNWQKWWQRDDGSSNRNSKASKTSQN